MSTCWAKESLFLHVFLFNRFLFGQSGERVGEGGWKWALPPDAPAHMFVPWIHPQRTSLWDGWELSWWSRGEARSTSWCRWNDPHHSLPPACSRKTQMQSQQETPCGPVQGLTAWSGASFHELAYLSVGHLFLPSFIHPIRKHPSLPTERRTLDEY